MLDQPDLHNAVAALEVPAGPSPAEGALALLLALKGLEAVFGQRERARWGARELDLDLLLFGRHRVRVERPARARSSEPARADVQWLEVPHPSMHERLFVLAPLTDLAPRLVPPGWREMVAQAAARRRGVEGDDAVVAVGRWSRRGWTAEDPVPPV